MTKQQEKERNESRQEWLERLDKLIKCTKLDHNDEDFIHVSDLVELIWDIPEYDISDDNRKKYLRKLGVKV